jgi:hypothetical protein
MLALDRRMARSRKRPTTSFEIPADVASAPQSGWVFRSDAKGEPKPARAGKAPAALRRATSKAVRRKDTASREEHGRGAPGAAAAGPRRGGLMRLVWLPLAIVCSAFVALLPTTGPRSRS